MKKFNIQEVEKWLKRCLKEKVSINEATVVRYCMLGIIGAFLTISSSLYAGTNLGGAGNLAIYKSGTETREGEDITPKDGYRNPLKLSFGAGLKARKVADEDGNNERVLVTTGGGPEETGLFEYALKDANGELMPLVKIGDKFYSAEAVKGKYYDETNPAGQKFRDLETGEILEAKDQPPEVTETGKGLGNETRIVLREKGYNGEPREIYNVAHGIHSEKVKEVNDSDDGVTLAKNLITNAKEENDNPKGLIHLSEKELGKVATLGDLRTAAIAGLTFIGNDKDSIHRTLGTDLHIVGEGKLDENTTDVIEKYKPYSGENIVTQKDPTAGNHKLLIKLSKTPRFDGITLSKKDNPDDEGIGENPVNLKPGETSNTLILSGVEALPEGVDDPDAVEEANKKYAPVTIKNVAPGVEAKDAVNKSQLDSATPFEYIDKGENKLVKIVDEDGTKFYKADELEGKYYDEDEKKFRDLDTGSISETQPGPVDTKSVLISSKTKNEPLLNITNIASGLGLDTAKEDDNEDNLKYPDDTNIKDAVTELAEKTDGLNNVATVRDLKALTLAGLDFGGNQGDPAHRNLGTKLDIVGKVGNVDDFDTAYSVDNVATKVETAADGLATLSIGISKNPRFDTIELGAKADDPAEDKKIVLTPDAENSTLTLSKNGGDDPVKLTGLKDADLTANSTDAVTGKQLKDVGDKLGLTLNGEKNGFDAPEFTKLLDVDGTEITPTGNPNFLSVLNSTISKVNDGITFGATLGDNTADPKKKQQLGSTLEVKEGDITDNGIEYKSTNLKTKYKNENGNGLITIGLKDEVEFKSITLKNGKDKKAGTMTVSDEGNVIFNNPIYVGNKIEDDNSNKVVTFADLKPTTDSEKTRYVSIKKDDTDKDTAGSNYNNDGAAGKSSIAIGRFAKATEDYSVAVGSASEASAKDALVFGNYSKAEAAGAVTLGNTSNAKKEDSVALGSRSLANREKDIIGYNFDGHNDDEGILGDNKDKYNQLTAEITTLDKEIEKEREKYDAAGEDEKPEIDKEIDKKIKIRNKKLADKNKLISTWKSTLGAVAVGNSETGDTRQITGVAAGTEDTDAVNLAQLKSLADKSIFFKAQFDEAAVSERKNSENKTFTIRATENTIEKDNANFVGGNLITKLEGTDKGATISIGLKETPRFNSIELGAKPTDVNATDNKIVLTPDAANSTLTLSKNAGDPVKLTGLKDAELRDDSKDAVTGKQLKKLGTTLGLEPENNDNTTFKAPEFTKLLEVDGNPANPANPNFLSVLNSTITKVNDGITFGATLGDNTAEAKKKQQLGSTLEVKEGDITDNGTEYKSTNLKTKYKNENGNGLISIGLKDKVEFAELKIVDGGVTGPIINKNGINAGNKKITNVETGKDGTDAVNVDQLNAAIADLGPKTKVSANGGQEAGNTNGNIELKVNGNPADPKNPLTYDVALNPTLTGITSLENGATNGTGGAKITLGSNDKNVDFNGGNLTNVASGIDPTKIGNNKIEDDKIEEITKLIAGEDKDGKGGLYAIDGENLKKVATVGDLQALAKAGLIFAANKGDEVHRVLGTKLSILGDTEKFDKLKDNTKELEKYLAGFSSKNVITVSDKDSNSINIKIADTPEFKGITLEGPNGANNKPEATIELGTANGTSTLFNPSEKEGAEGADGKKPKVDERIVYTPKDADGNPIVGKDKKPIVREVATMDDGMIFEGDKGATKKKLNDTVKIVGGIVDENKLSNDDNVGVILDSEENLVIKLAKEMTGITSIGGGRDDATDKDDNSTITFGKDDISLTTNGATLKVEKDSKAADGTTATTENTISITGLTDRTVNTTAGYGEAGRAATEAAVKELADQLGLGKDKDSTSKTEAGKADKQNDNKTVAERVTALRDGTSGPIVYTDADGNRVVVGEDGKYYKPTDIADKKYVEGKGYFNKDDVTEKPDGTYALKQGVNEDTKVEEASGIKHSLVNATNGSTINSPSVLSNVAEGKSDTDAVNVKQLKDSIKESTYSFSISANKNDTEADKDKIGKDENVLFKADNNLNVSYDKDKNIMTYGLNNTITLGEKAEEGTNGTDRKEGIDGSIGVNGKDGSAVTINGANGSISLNGKDGANALTIKSENGKVGVDETAEKTRIVYERPNPDGTNTPIKEEVATLNDGMKFAGDTGDVIKKKLNETVNIVGGVTEEAKLTDSNIGVVSDGKGNLTIKLAKNVTGLDSVETKKITVIDEVGNTTVINGDKITITPKDGKEVSLSASGLDNGGNQISNVAAGTEGHHAVNVTQLNEVSNAIINYTDQKINKLDDRMKRGLAGSAAMAGLEFMEIGINQSTVAAAVGGYKGAQAVAVGIQGAPTENTRVNAKFSITPGRTVESMYSVGAAYRFNWK